MVSFEGRIRLTRNPVDVLLGWRAAERPFAAHWQSRCRLWLRMGRFFLSGQTTCALLLGAGLLLRAQAALRPAEAVAAGAPRTGPSEMLAERAPRVPRPPALAAAEKPAGART